MVRRVKGKKAQQAGVRAVVQRDQQLAVARELDLAVRHHPLNLRHLALLRVAQFDDAGFVLVAQRQVQSQVNGPHQAKFLQGFLGRAQGLGLVGGGRRGTHGVIVAWQFGSLRRTHGKNVCLIILE